ncbi:MAG TPA: hypothetical protein VKM55_17445, partial [Candidatus Lokiarchaeia archaeon]|nr:hypothetical protein [Candidatus Lokiarchaeia archaeon]
VLSLAKIGGKLVMGDPGKVESTSGIDMPAPVRDAIKALVLTDPTSPEAAAHVATLQDAIRGNYQQFEPILNEIKAARQDFFDQPDSHALADLQYAYKEGRVLAASREMIGRVLAPADSMELDSLGSSAATICRIPRLETGRILLDLVKEGWLINDEGNIRLNVPDNEIVTLTEAKDAQQMEAVAEVPPSPSVEQAVTAIIDKNPGGIGTIQMPDEQLMAMQAASLMFARAQVDAGMITDASQAAAIQSVESRLQDMFPAKITPEIAKENPNFMRQAGKLFITSDFSTSDIATEAKVIEAMSRASRGYVDYFATLKDIYGKPSGSAKNIAGAMLEVKMEYFASWTSNLLDEWGAQPESRAGYEALLSQVFHDTGTVNNIINQGTGVQWSVVAPEGKGMDVRLVATNPDGQYIASATFECKARDLKSWGTDTGIVTEMLRQMAIATKSGEASNVFYYVVSDIGTTEFGQIKSLLSLQRLSLLSSLEIPNGLARVLNSMAQGGFFNDPEHYYDNAFVITNPTSHAIEGMIRIAPGTSSVLNVDPISHELIATFEFCEYVGPTGPGTNVRFGVGYGAAYTIGQIEDKYPGVALWATSAGGSQNWVCISSPVEWIVAGSSHQAFTDAATNFIQLL